MLLATSLWLQVGRLSIIAIRSQAEILSDKSNVAARSWTKISVAQPLGNLICH